MSSYRTHAIVGVATGCGLATALPLPPPTLSAAAVPTWMLLATCGALALVPDLDHPQAYLSRRLRMLGLLLGGIIGGWQAVTAHVIPVTMTGGLVLIGSVLLGMVYGTIIGWGLPLGINLVAGGHRKLTHSLVSSVVLALGAIVAYTLVDLTWEAIGLGLLALSIPIHVLADVVTPSGVPILYPLSSRRFRIPLGAAGEPIILLMALGVITWYGVTHFS